MARQFPLACCRNPALQCSRIASYVVENLQFIVSWMKRYCNLHIGARANTAIESNRQSPFDSFDY
jgi:hypothetical protein